MIRIDRCVCANRTFASLLGEAQHDDLSLDQLATRCGAGDGCRTCLPYLRQTLATGQTVYDALIEADDAGEQSAASPR